MEQLTKEQAIAIYKGGEWKNWTDEQIVKLQIYQKKLCVPFSVFHKAIGKILERPVYTHEFAGDEGHSRLIEEYEGKRPKPTFDEIANLIPEEKRIVIRY